jgi:single-strand DNA-binding protein
VSRSLNKIMLIGNLGQDPEIRTTANGTRVANFSLATSRRWTGQDGQQQEKTEWHRIVVWEQKYQGRGGGEGGGMSMVDVVERYLKKGEKAYVEGSIEYRQYEDKDGVTKYSTEIRAREILLLGGRAEGAEGGGGGRREYGGGGGGGGYGGGGGGGYGGGGGGRAQQPAARSGGGGGGGGAPAGGGRGGNYDDFQAPPFEDDDDLPF